MKFSQKKKAKIKKINQRRINRTCKEIIGYSIDDCHTVIDQTKIAGVIYLLTQDKNGEYAIYKIIKVFNYVKISSKKILQNQKQFSNYAYWRRDSIIQISSEGKIETVTKYRKVYKPRYISTSL